MHPDSISTVSKNCRNFLKQFVMMIISITDFYTLCDFFAPFVYMTYVIMKYIIL